MTRVFVVWDESHLWGLLVLRALRSLGVPHAILRATDIAEGALSGKCGTEAQRRGLVIVPGGWARGRALLLGERGLSALRDFVAAGGSYLGFCGGAGLALTPANPGEALGLCSWRRMGFAEHMQHFLSGHTRLALAPNAGLVPPGTASLLAPVWWPAQFEPPERDDPAVTVLARYAGLGPDFWVADLELARIPPEALGDWENLYGVRIRPDFLFGRPAVIAGTYGRGRYVLSYPHLETPDSPEANRWLAHLLGELAGEECPEKRVAPWQVGGEDVRWEDPALGRARAALEKAVRLGRDHMLLFWRNSWLLGWRRGIPGAGINSLLSLVCEAQSCTPTETALAYWREHAERFARMAELFCRGLAGLLLAERLDMTVRASDTDRAFAAGLRETRRALFGSAPATGGLCGELLGMLEDLCALAWG